MYMIWIENNRDKIEMKIKICYLVRIFIMFHVKHYKKGFLCICLLYDKCFVLIRDVRIFLLINQIRKYKVSLVAWVNYHEIKENN